MTPFTTHMHSFQLVSVHGSISTSGYPVSVTILPRYTKSWYRPNIPTREEISRHSIGPTSRTCLPSHSTPLATLVCCLVVGRDCCKHSRKPLPRVPSYYNDEFLPYGNKWNNATIILASGTPPIMLSSASFLEIVSLVQSSLLRTGCFIAYLNCSGFIMISHKIWRRVPTKIVGCCLDSD